MLEIDSGLRSFSEKELNKARSFARVFSRSLWGHPLLSNVNKVQGQEYSKRALLIYLVEPFQLKGGDRRFYDHQNLKQGIQIARVLGEAGYTVDVADMQDDRLNRRKLGVEYDLIVSHRVDLGELQEYIPDRAIKVYLATGMNHHTYNKNLLARWNRLRARRPCAMKQPALNQTEMPFVRSADAVVGFGNRYTTGTWRDVTSAPVYPFNNYGYSSDEVIGAGKGFDTARNHFLFFASRNQLGKGLDLLLEIFPRHPELHLYVCSLYKHEGDFCACYRTELFHTPNIHPIGTTPVNSRRFSDLVQRCAFVILPSCGEGQPGSVVQAMHAGLIPLVTKETGIDVADIGWQFEDDGEKMIEALILHVAGLPSETLLARAQQTRRIVETRYSEEAFLRRWKEIVSALEGLPRKSEVHEVQR